MKNLLLSSNNLTKASLGLMFLFLLFIFSIVIVLGVKSIIFILREKLTVKAPPQKQVVKRPRKPINKIEINPDEDTRIVFKKSS